jgi:ABC-2 type transport system permease protein
MRKTLVIAVREYLAAVRTKTFIISLLIMPIMMGGSIIMQVVFKGMADIADKQFVLINRGVPQELIDKITAAADEYNKNSIFEPETKRQIKPRFVIRVEKARTPADEQRYELSEQAKAGKIVGFVEISPVDKEAATSKDEPAKTPARVLLRYQSNRPTYMDFSSFITDKVTKAERDRLAAESKLSQAQVNTILAPVKLDSKGLSKRDATGKIVEASEQSRLAAIFVPIILMMLMFMVVMMTATPLMQSVVEEKMQRIAEVLLGSVRPFQLMMGKLAGMMTVSLTIAAVYLGGGCWAAVHFGFAEHISVELVIWFLVFQMMADLMFGSLFIAVGAACTDMKETQNLLLPIMLLVCIPLFLLGNVIQDPGSPVVRGLSFFPFATPNLMIARIALQPGIPWWEPALGVVLVLISTVLCVYAAGRIFRVGILMQGKGARIGEMMKWVVRG